MPRQATVGAIADWYAVVALFRRPFGLPIPHTAIIARNQQRIAESLGNFVEENFLTPELIIGRLSGHNAAQALAQMARGAGRTAGRSRTSSPTRYRACWKGIDEADVERFFDRLVIPQLRTLDVSRAAGSVLKVLTEGDRHQPLLDHGLRALEKWLTANVDMIKAKFSEASRYTPAPLDAYIVRKFVEGIVALLHEVAANPGPRTASSVRRRGAGSDRAVADIAVHPPRRPIADARLHSPFPTSGDYYRVLLDHVRTRVTADLANEHSALRGATTGMLASLGKESWQ